MLFKNDILKNVILKNVILKNVILKNMILAKKFLKGRGFFMRKKALALLLTLTMLAGAAAGMTPGSTARAQSDDTTTQDSTGTGTGTENGTDPSGLENPSTGSGATSNGTTIDGSGKNGTTTNGTTSDGTGNNGAVEGVGSGSSGDAAGTTGQGAGDSGNDAGTANQGGAGANGQSGQQGAGDDTAADGGVAGAQGANGTTSAQGTNDTAGTTGTGDTSIISWDSLSDEVKEAVTEWLEEEGITWEELPDEYKEQLIALLGEARTFAFTMMTHKIEWIAASQKATISADKTKLEVTPSSNSVNTATAKVTMSTGGETVAPGMAEIRLPRYIFFKRDGTPAAEPKLSILQAPQKGGVTSFNYYIDTHNDGDPKTDEIVITNYKELAASANFFDCTVQWEYYPVEIADEYTKDNINASFHATGADGTALEETSEDGSLSVKINTAPKISSVDKTADKKYESWQSAWGTKPPDADDYFYVVWKLYCSMDYYCTSAYTLYFEDFPGSDVDGAEIVAWSKGFYNASDSAAKTFTAGNAEQMKDDPVIVNSTTSEVISQNRRLIYRNVVVRYPKEMTRDENGNAITPKINNTFTAKAVTPENKVVQKVKIGSYIYQHVATEVPYPGDTIGSWKNAYSDNSSATQTTKSYPAALNILRNGSSVIGSWSVDVMQRAYSMTEDGKKPYKTVLHDGMLYIAGERLVPGDYEIVKFYPNQYDVLVAKHDDDIGDYLENSTEYAKDYKPIKVFYRTEQGGSWTEYGSVRKTATNTYTWTRVGAGAVTCNNSTPINLPPGVVDIKFEHEDAAYGVEYRMSLFHKLNPTPHVMGLIGKDTTQFNLINLSEAYGEQNGKITTTGTFLNNSTTAGIKADVEASDKKDYVDTGMMTGKAGVIHSTSQHVLTSAKGTASFSKSLGTPVNDVKNSKVTIPVNLVWDYYISYKNLGVTIQEAAAAQIIKESREGVFYDLLPKGCTIDVSTIKCTPYSTKNYEDKTISKCDYTLELVNNWRDSGQTMAIIRVTVPEGYVNFAKSSTYLDTGFKVSFNMIDTWDNIIANGATLNNNAAYICQEGSVPNGSPDNGAKSNLPDLFKDLYTTDGDYSKNDENVRYAAATKTLNVQTASEASFDKLVKGAGDAYYSESAKIPATGQYSYELRYSISTGSDISGIVMYDVLEVANKMEDGTTLENWKGTFQSVDVSAIQKKYPECDVKVYYTDKTPDDGVGIKTLSEEWSDLTKSHWTTNRGSLARPVTGIAIDLSKKTVAAGGGNMMFKGPASLTAEIFMDSPKTYETYVAAPGRPAVLTHNKAYAKKTGTTNLESSEVVTVEITEPKVSLNKTSVPSTGTTAAPKNVQVDDEIKYTLDVSNKNVAEAITKVKVVDTLPAGVTLADDSACQFYFGSAPSTIRNVGAGERVQAEITAVDSVTGAQTVTFTVDKLAGNETVHLVIPTRVNPTARKGVVLENEAKITEFNNKNDWNITSQKTYHKTTPETTSVSVKKVWVDQGVPNVKKPVVVKLYQDGVEMTSKSATLQAPSWTATFTNLPKYKDNGIDLYEYTVVEDALDGFITSYARDASGTLIVTNTIQLVNENGAGVLKIKKLRKDTTVLVPNARFEVYKRGATKGTDPVLATGVTGTDGFATFSIAIPTDIGANTIYELDVYEISVPNGYTKIEAPIQVTLKKDSTPTNTYDAATNTYKNIYLWKVDSTSISIGTVTGGTVTGNVSWDATNQAVEVKNEYHTTPVELQIPVKKIIEGNDRPAGADKTFTFTLTKGTPDPATLDVPMPGGATGTTATVTVTGEAVKAFDTITFTKPGTYVYTIRENDILTTGYTGYTKKNDPTRTIRVVVTDDDSVLRASYTVDGSMLPTATIQDINGNDKVVTVAEFTNVYKPTAASVTFGVQKTIDGDPIPKGENNKTFTFTLTGIGGTPTPAGNQVSVKFDNSGNTKSVNFPALSFTETGTYKYAIMENGGSIPGYTFDGTQHLVNIKVTDNDGQLQAELQKSDGTPFGATQVNFTNTYKPAPVKLSIPVKKTITGTERPEGNLKEFTFELTAGTNNASVTTPMPAGTTAGTTTTTVTITDEGMNLFKDIKFEKAGEYRYTVTEPKPTTWATAYRGYTFDGSTHNITVTVTDTNGVLRASWVSDTATDNENGKGKQVGFTNKYEPNATNVLEIPVSKTIVADSQNRQFPTGTTYTPSFVFTLTSVGGAPLPANPQNEVTLTMDSVGDYKEDKFGSVKFTKAGTYYYQINEKKISGNNDFVYDISTHSVEVNVKDVDGQLVYTLKVDGTDVDVANPTAVGYNNIYSPPADKISFKVHKEVDNHARVDAYKKEFVFELKAIEANAPMPTNPKTSIIDTGDGWIGEIGYDTNGTFHYTIVEKKQTQTGYKYDENVCNITVVSENVILPGGGSGYRATVTYENTKNTDTTQAYFKNTYTPEATTYQLPVYKKITGDERPGSTTFNFNIAAKSPTDAPLPANTVAKVRGREGDIEGSGKFGAIEFTKSGTYKYTVTEDSSAAVKKPGYTYDPSSYEVTIVVEDNDGKLKVGNVTYSKTKGGTTSTETKALFENVYHPEPLKWKMPVTKEITGTNRKLGSYKTFKFTLQSTGGAPAPTPNMTTITDTGDGLFGEMTFDKPGTYTYKVKEETGTAKGYTYDTVVRTVTVVVTDQNGKLGIDSIKTTVPDPDPDADPDAVIETDGQPIFVNNYSPLGSTFSLTAVQKRITGPGKGNGTFTFVLDSPKGAPLPANCTATVTGEGVAAFPDEIPITGEGVFEYRIREQASGGSYHFDGTVYYVTLVVEDINGQLTVTQKYEKQVGTDREDITEVAFTNTYIPPAVGDDGGYGGDTPEGDEPDAEEEIPTFESEEDVPDPDDPEAPPVIRLIRDGIEKIFYRTETPDGILYIAEDGEVLGRRRMRSPSTGDNAHPEVYASLMVISLAGIVICLIRRRKLQK